MKNILPILFFASILTFNAKKLIAQKLAVNTYVSGLNLPIDIKTCGDDRLFVAERPGRMRVINADGTLRTTPFLDVTAKVSSYTNGEEGFLGIAFSPNYKTDGKFFVDYTANIAGQLTTVIEQYKADPADSNLALTTGVVRILSVAQPFSNHNGGNLMFGKDGYLYINLGDGGSGGDPNGNGQNTNTFLAKILRIDISNSSVRQPYRTPSTNPFYGQGGIKPEIWAYGVRNPWRSSFDRITNDLWIADVGQAAVEEIDFQTANAAGGNNYGWNIMEGTTCYNPPSGCNQTGLTLPIYDYTHAVGQSITGGYVYRSAQSKSLWGVYLFADYVAKWIDGITQSNGIASPVTHYITAAQATGNPISFGQDNYGDLYILFNNDGTVYKLQDTSYLRKPKAYFTPIDQGNGSFLFQGLQGRNITYQWLLDDAPIAGATNPDYMASASGSYQLIVINALGTSDTSVAYLLGALPLNLTSFTAQKLTGNNRVKLEWNTAAEQNIKGYNILRKENDQAGFSKIGFVESKSLNGNSSAALIYTFFDSSVTNRSKLFYRLQILNIDGSSSYSAIRSITYGDIKNNFTISPNPANGHVQIVLENAANPALMMLYDNSGKKIKEQKLTQQSNTIDLSGLRGIYIVQLSDGNGTNVTRKKLVVQ